MEFWIYQVGDTKQEVNFGDGKRNGWSRYYDRQGTLIFEGKFVDDLPNGEHKWYWPNGKLKEWGHYTMGRKNGEWKKEGVKCLYDSRFPVSDLPPVSHFPAGCPASADDPVRNDSPGYRLFRLRRTHPHLQAGGRRAR